MVPFQTIVEILRGSVLRSRHSGLQCLRIALGLIRRHLRGLHITCGNRSLEECLRCCGIPPITEVHVDDLPVLVERAIVVALALTDLQARLIDPPACANRGAMGTGRSDEPRGEGLHPVVDRAGVDLDAPLRKPLHHIGIAQTVA